MSVGSGIIDSRVGLLEASISRVTAALLFFADPKNIFELT